MSTIIVALMPRDHIVAGLDIGTSMVYTIVAQKRHDVVIPQIIGVGAAPSAGMRRGTVVDADEVIKSIRHSAAEAQRVSGVAIERVYVGVGGTHISCIPSKGVVAVSRADQEISNEDVERVLAAAQAISLPSNREIVHVFPSEYIVDGEGGLHDAVGMNGVRLEVNTLIVGGSSPYIKILKRCTQEAGLEVAGMVLNSFASSKAVLSKRQKELGVVCIDIGGGTTSLVVFEEGDIVHTAVFPIGSMHITNDIAIGLRTSIDVAERVKKEYGLALVREASKKETIDLNKIDPQEEGTIMRRDVAEIVEARLGELFDFSNKELRKIGKEAFLPGGVVLVGGGAKVPLIIDLAKERMRLPVQIGFPREVEGIVDSVDDPAFATALGLVFWGLELEDENGGIQRPQFSSLNGSVGKMRKWFRAFLP
ncbi:MAG: cell division protein FtsA [Candidatus Spechtbacteria bacterium]|nr:cell division protein FtsA [Candidatus Spechtbacteria bacterium]